MRPIYNHCIQPLNFPRRSPNSTPLPAASPPQSPGFGDAGGGILPQPPAAFIFILFQARFSSSSSSSSSPFFSFVFFWTSPSCFVSALVVVPALCSPLCHFCARVPFTLSVRMCDMKPQLQTFPACDQNSPGEERLPRRQGEKH